MATEETASDSMREDYWKWRAMGEGGVAPNWAGYLSVLAIEKMIAFDDTISPLIYDDPEQHATGWSSASSEQRSAAQRSFLKEPLPEREGPRSRAKPYIIPQRERNATEGPDEEIRSAYQKLFDQLGEANASATEWKTSELEKQGTALFLKQDHPLTPLAPSVREICHVHRSDCSAHVTLSFADAKEVIAKGWGERHRLSGRWILPLGYTMLYVPRSVDETEVLTKVFQAGVDFMRSG